MRIDVVSIFPDYLAPLELSLAGQGARSAGCSTVHVHDLRDWTHDRHRTVDDTPYGGGAGMVMKPEPWGEALDDVLTRRRDAGRPHARRARRSRRRSRASWPRRDHLVVACGRYEGIDQRVVDHYAATDDVRELSIGDYVLNGGEVAALVVVEAVARLLPGLHGQRRVAGRGVARGRPARVPRLHQARRPGAASTYPPVLLSRRPRARSRRGATSSPLRRTAERRPDLLPASAVPGRRRRSRPAVARRRRRDPDPAAGLLDAGAAGQPDAWVPALHESLDDVRRWLPEWTVLTLRRAGRLVAAARARLEGDVWDVGRLMVAPGPAGPGARPAAARGASRRPPPTSATTYSLFTGAGSTGNHRFYQRAGYRLRGRGPRRPAGAVQADASRFRADAVGSGRLAPRPRRPTRVSSRTSVRQGGLRRAPATGGVGRRRPPDWATMLETLDSAADLWHP